ncbi:heat shock protein [Perilla frutescens var. hirtella]|nr:heat shock protein [Perilla frutescens var. frutescens]KAH6793925.1 heat shock protein [Perilla frutescens var. hirtella]KAH6818826.1 heat shock protein [Perilla frutescens var. frutescens]
MKVHPVPRKRNITLRYDVASLLAQANSCRQKKLRRLPHIFAKVLELPFHSDADVSIDETPESIRFTAATDDISGDVRADAVEIYPGVTKIVIRGNGVVDLSGTEFELDLWRFRLPPSTRPELVSSAYEDGELIVTVPKGAAAEDDDGGGAMGNGSRLVLVQ